MILVDAPRILLSTSSRISPKGYHQTINHCRIGGRRVTEVITNLGDGQQGIRKIYYDIIGAEPERIVDTVAGRCEIYTSGAPERPYDVIQEIEGIKCYLPFTLEKLASDF